MLPILGNSNLSLEYYNLLAEYEPAETFHSVLHYVNRGNRRLSILIDYSGPYMSYFTFLS